MNFLSNLNRQAQRSLLFIGCGFVILILLWGIVLGIQSQKTGFRPASFFDSSHLIYINEQGNQLYGSQKIEDDFYYFDEETGYMHTGFLKTDEGTYYYDSEGKRVTGLYTIEGDSYYFNKTGKMITRKFQTIQNEDTSYVAYFDEDGIMVQGDTQINGILYHFDEDGRLQLSIESMESQIQNILNQYQGTNSVYFKDLESGQVIQINNTNMYPCSIIKIFVMGAVYDQANQGLLDLEECKPYLEAMIIDSDNTSYNTLLTLLGNGDGVAGTEIVNQFCIDLGLDKTELHHGLTPGDGYFEGSGDNTTCPEDVGQFLELLYNKKVVSKEASEAMIDLLSRCADDSGIVAGLPEGTTCAHKSGWAQAYYLDGGIIYSSYGDYILVVFSDSAWQEPAVEVSSYVYEYVNSLYTK